MRLLLSRSFITSVLFLSAVAAWAGANYDYLTASQYIGIGTTSVNSKAALDISSTTKGLLLPRMTTTQKNAITSPPDGLIVFDTTTGAPYYFASSSWNQFLSSSSSLFQLTDTSTPSTPSSGTIKVYSKSGVLMALNSGGSEIGLQHGSQPFTANGNFTVPAGVQQITVCGCGGGGGGGGGGSNGARPGGAGGEGSPLRCFPSSVTAGAVHAVVLGAGGAKGTKANNGNPVAGANGGSAGIDTTFGSLFTFYGGGGAQPFSATVSVGGSRLAGGATGGSGGAGAATPIATAGFYGLFAPGTPGTTSGTDGGGGSGGGGGNGVGGNGTNGSGTTTTNAVDPAANSCAGGGGGGAGGSIGGAGDGANGGSGYLIVYW